MFEKLVKWIKKSTVWTLKKVTSMMLPKKFTICVLKQAIAILLPEYHLSKNPVRKQKEKEEGINNE